MCKHCCPFMRCPLVEIKRRGGLLSREKMLFKTILFMYNVLNKTKLLKMEKSKQFNKLNKKILFNVTYTNFWIIFFLLSVSNAKNDWSIKNRVLNKFLTSLDAPQKPVIRINRDMVDGPIETFLIKNKIWTPSLVQKFRHTIEWKCAA